LSSIRDLTEEESRVKNTHYSLLWCEEVISKRIKMLLHLFQHATSAQNKHNLVYKQDHALHHFPSA
jgi:hypothetical protein